MLQAEGSQVPIHNIVFMGMGEPFHNYDAVSAAVQILTEQDGLQFSKWVAACCLLPAACCLLPGCVVIWSQVVAHAAGGSSAACLVAF